MTRIRQRTSVRLHRRFAWRACLDVRARRLRRQHTLTDLDWEQVEEVILDVFRSHAHQVRDTGGRGTADGGLELVLEVMASAGKGSPQRH